MSQHRRALFVAPLALMGLVGVGFALPSGAAEAPYTDSGTAVAPAPTLSVTDLTFFQNCPESPAQGVDGWVFTLPEGYAGGRAAVTADGADLSAYTYTDDCQTSELIEGVEDGIVLGAHDRYLSVFATTTPDVTFALTVERGSGADPTPTATATPTATSTTPPAPGGVMARHTYPATPDDPMFPDSGALPLTETFERGQWGMIKVGAPQAWQERRATGAGIEVGVLDTGLDVGHPDFACDPGKVKLVAGNTEGGVPMHDDGGHGTHVAGIIGACTDNGTGVVGMAPDATIVPFKVLDEDSIPVLGDAIRRATDAGVHVINMSLGFNAAVPVAGVAVPGSGTVLSQFGPPQEVDSAVAYARSQGVVVVASAGNEDSPLCGYPAYEKGVICVGATNRRDTGSFYSNFVVRADDGDPLAGAAMVAPGGDGVFCDVNETILSTYSRTATEEHCNTALPAGYESMNGTSQAAPHVAGAAALVYDRLGGDRTPENAAKVIEALTATAVDLGAPGFDPEYGSGRLDALAAVTYWPAAADPTPTPTATTTEVPTSTTLTTLTAASSGQYSDRLPVTVAVTTENGSPVAGADVLVSVESHDITRTTTVTTGADGTASLSQELDVPPGDYALSARYAGGPTTTGSFDRQPLDVLREDTSLKGSSTTSGGTGTVTARLTDADTATSGVGGATVVLVDDKGAEHSVVTDATGTATWQVRGSAKSKAYTLRFAGDATWLASSATA